MDAYLSTTRVGSGEEVFALVRFALRQELNLCLGFKLKALSPSPKQVNALLDD